MAALLAVMAGGVPQPPVSFAPTRPPCQVQPASLDIDRLRSTKDVLSVIPDAKKLNATVLFADGDVLKVQSKGCITSVIDAKLWISNPTFVDASLIEKAKQITSLILSPVEARQVEISMDKEKFDSAFNRVRHIEDDVSGVHAYQIFATLMPLGDSGQFMDISYINPKVQ
ncbi:MAG: hypothetical protein WA777_00410 [Rhodanobacter sp.]